MSDNWEYGDDGEGQEDSKLVKDLRKQLAEQSKALKALQTKERERSVQSALSRVPESKRGKLAKLVPADADVEEWLTEYADVFGLNSDQKDEGSEESTAPPVTQPSVDPAQQADLKAIQSTMQNGTSAASTNADAEAKKIQDLPFEELLPYLQKEYGTSR